MASNQEAVSKTGTEFQNALAHFNTYARSDEDREVIHGVLKKAYDELCMTATGALALRCPPGQKPCDGYGCIDEDQPCPPIPNGAVE